MTFTHDEIVHLLAKVYVQDILKGSAVLSYKWLDEKGVAFNDGACSAVDGVGRHKNTDGVIAERCITEIVISEPAGGVQVTLGQRYTYPGPATPMTPTPEPPSPRTPTQVIGPIVPGIAGVAGEPRVIGTPEFIPVVRTEPVPGKR